MEEKEIVSSKKSNTVILVLLVIIICLLIVYIAYYKIIVNQKINEPKQSEEIKKEEKEEEKEEEKVLTERDVLSYIEDINKVLVSFGDKVPMKTADLSNEDVLKFAFWKAEWNGEKKTAQSVSQVIEDVFGKDFSYQLGDIPCFAGDGIIYAYNQAEGTFTRVGQHGHGGEGGFRPRLYFIEGKQTSDTITIKAKVLYGNYCGDICGPITSFYSKATYDINESIYHIDDVSQGDNYDFVYNEVKDKLPVTSFILKKQSDDKFALTEITVEK